MRVNDQIINVPIKNIKQNRNQPRKVFNQNALMELAESIKEYGVLQPINIRKSGENIYELVAGERRLRATQLAGLEDIPALIVDMNDNESAVLAMIENLQREDLNFIEEAEGYNHLIKEFNFTQEELAQKIGKKQSTIANKLRILKLSDYVKEIILKNNLTERHARALIKLNDEALQIKIVNEVVKNDLTVKRTEEIIQKIIDEKSDKEELKGEKKKVKWAINPKIITNTIKQIMDKSGIKASYGIKDKEDYMEIIVKIPKK